METGEDTVTAAVRETVEETGYVVPAGCVSEACWRGEITYLWLGRRHWAETVMHVAHAAGPLDRRATDWRSDEQASFLEPCWLPVADVLAGRGASSPARCRRTCRGCWPASGWTPASPSGAEPRSEAAAAVTAASGRPGWRLRRTLSYAMTVPTPARARPTARVLLLDPDGRVLLMAHTDKGRA